MINQVGWEGVVFLAWGDVSVLHTSLVIGGAVGVLAVIFCHLTVLLHWSPIERMALVDAHVQSLLRIRNMRTRRYRIAWGLSLLSVAGVVLSTICYHVARYGTYSLAPFLAVLAFAAFILFGYDRAFRGVRAAREARRRAAGLP
jgi:hypothetical protein